MVNLVLYLVQIFGVVLRSNSRAKQIVFPKAEILDKHSPYLLLPEDELVLGYQYPISYNHRNYGFGANDNNTNKITFSKHKISKITLYGSLIKNKVEYHDTLNQPLTSESVHESLHDDNPVLDQFDLSYRNEYSGSYLDLYRSDEESLSADSDVTARSIVGGGENELPASLQRFVRLSSNREIFFDTMTPDPRNLWRHQTGVSPILSSSGTTILSFGVTGSDTQNPELIQILGNPNDKWFRSNVYNNSLGRVTFNAQRSNMASTELFFNDGVFHKAANANGKDQSVRAFTGFNFNGNESFVGVPRLDSPESKKQTGNFLMWLYGFGTGPTGSLEGSNPSSDDTYAVVQRPRGYKYGIMAPTELFRSNVFRYNKFGQFADMLEQSIDTITYDKLKDNRNSPPILINFVTRENEDTFKILDKRSIVANTFDSSNLDLNASSSIPFIDDDVARNRGTKASTSTDTSSRTTVTVVRDTIDQI